MSLAGKFFLHFAKDHFHVVEVIEQISPDVVLVKFDESEVDEISPMVLINVSLLLTKLDKDGCPSNGCEFFNSHQDLNDFLESVRGSPDDDGASKPPKTVTVN